MKAIAKRTYQYFADYTDPATGLTYDEVRTTDKGTEEANRTSLTNIFMYMMSTVSAQQLGIILRAGDQSFNVTASRKKKQKPAYYGRAFAICKRYLLLFVISIIKTELNKKSGLCRSLFI
ncbi:hypothetical protein [Paenibacillus sp. Z6-24]